MNIRIINSTRLALWRAARIQVEVLYTLDDGRHAVRVHPALRSADLP